MLEQGINIRESDRANLSEQKRAILSDFDYHKLSDGGKEYLEERLNHRFESISVAPQHEHLAPDEKLDIAGGELRQEVATQAEQLQKHQQSQKNDQQTKQRI